MTEPAWWPPRLTGWVDRVDARWQAAGIEKSTRTRLRRDLVTDLGQALLSGASVDDLTAIHPEHFADDVVLAEGLDASPATARPSSTPAPVEHLRLVIVAFAGAFVGGVFSLLTVIPVGVRLADRITLSYTTQGYVMLGAYGAAGLIAATCGALAARRLFRDRRRPWLLATAVGFALALSGLVAALLTVFSASTTGYSGQPGVVVTELILVVLICAGGVGIVSWLLAPRHDLGMRTGSAAR